MTKDSVTVFVNAIMYYKVKDAILAVANVDDYASSAKLLAATTLRNILGTKTLADILSERESIAHDMQVEKCQSGIIIKLQDYNFRRVLMKPRSPGVCMWRGSR